LNDFLWNEIHNVKQNSCKLWYQDKEVKGWEGQCLKFLIRLCEGSQNLMEILNRFYAWGKLDWFQVDVEAIHFLFFKNFL
jgi:hypothetical protein